MSPPPGGRERASATCDALFPGMRRGRRPRRVGRGVRDEGGGFRGALRVGGGVRSSILRRLCDGVACDRPAAGAVSARGAAGCEDEVGAGRRLRGEAGAVGEGGQGGAGEVGGLGGGVGGGAGGGAWGER